MAEQPKSDTSEMSIDYSVKGRMKAFKTHRTEEANQALLKKFEDETDDLKDLTDFILRIIPEEFPDVQSSPFKIFFVKKQPLDEFAGKTKKLDDAIRFKFKADFMILIWKEYFDNANKADRAKLIIHELHHIMRDDRGLPKIRRHNEDENFCELPSHDLYSDGVFQKIRTKLSNEKSLP